MSYAFLRKTARVGGMACLAAVVASCTMTSQEAPDWTGPSEFSKSIVVQVSPDVLSQDGSAQSVITVTARGIRGEPLANVQMRAEIHVNGTPVDFGSLSTRTLFTNASGVATAVYTAPAAPPLGVDTGTVVDVIIRPLGSDFNNATIKTAAIRLVPPGIVIPPDTLRAAFTFSPVSPVDHGEVFFDASTSQGAIANYSWDFGDGGRGSGRTTDHAYEFAGTYHATLTVSDQFGRSASATQTVTVVAGSDPTALFVFSPTSPRINQNIAFNGSGSKAAPGQVITSYVWDFGDGTPRVTRTDPTINYVYRVAGTYNVTLLVTDSGGKSTATTISVTVLP